MNTVKQSRQFWEQVRDHVASNSNAKGVSIPRGKVPHPRDAGARLSSSWPVGQIADYAIDGSKGAPPLSIREFPDRWEVSIETAHMTSTVEDDPEKAMFVGAAMLGGSIGSSVSNKRTGMIVGIGLGLLLAAALMTVLDDNEAGHKKSRRRQRRS